MRWLHLLAWNLLYFHCNNIVPCALQLKGSRFWNALLREEMGGDPNGRYHRRELHISGVAPTVSYINLREPLELISSCK